MQGSCSVNLLQDQTMVDYHLLSFLFLVAGAIAEPVVTRFGLGSVFGYLMAGKALSPLPTLPGADTEHVPQFRLDPKLAAEVVDAVAGESIQSPVTPASTVVTASAISGGNVG